MVITSDNDNGNGNDSGRGCGHGCGRGRGRGRGRGNNNSIPCKNLVYSGLDISTCPLAQVSVFSVRRTQIIDHSPVW